MAVLIGEVPEEVRHASRNADSACPFLYWCNGKKGRAESAFHDACRTSSGEVPLKSHLLDAAKAYLGEWSVIGSRKEKFT